ncbi:hypothetical protein Dimus_020032 [Dionaea muscipula]
MEIMEELSCEYVQEVKLEHRENCNEVWEPKIGLLFDSEIAAFTIYDTYVKQQVFGVITLSVRKLNDVRHNITYDCPARINIVMMPDGRWWLNLFIIDHNHEFDIEAAKYLK